jgi:hypothetical protein
MPLKEKKKITLEKKQEKNRDIIPFSSIQDLTHH